VLLLEALDQALRLFQHALVVGVAADRADDVLGGDEEPLGLAGDRGDVERGQGAQQIELVHRERVGRLQAENGRAGHRASPARRARVSSVRTVATRVRDLR
jgi:hypothetical protein